MATIKRKCDNCGAEYEAGTRNLRRGWGLCCCKSCAAQMREKRKPGYNAARVERNNIRRELWNFHCDGAFNAREERDALDALDGCQWGDMDIGIHE